MQQTTKREVKIPVHYGMPDYYKWYKDNNECKVDSAQFNKIVSEFNEQIMELMLNNDLEYTPPKLQMSFVIRKTQRVPQLKDGKLVNKLPVDFKATKDLWESNPDAKEKKILVRHLNKHSGKYIFSIRLVKVGYNYSNRSYYSFKPARGFQRALAKRIFDEDKNTFDTFNLY